MDRSLTQLLRERGVRVTPQRALIWHTLAESGEHFSAEELWERVQGELPGLEVSTIYRSLEALREAGLVVESRMREGPRLFEARSTPHPHLLCESCGSISHLDTTAARKVLVSLRDQMQGFEARELHVLATGLCADCSRERETRS